jgi:formamidopyrimidine-DNA glycosylase
MFELAECVTLARQINESVTGKVVKEGGLSRTPHKFVWYNWSPDEFAALTAGKTVAGAASKGKWLFIPLEPGYVLLFGECGGKLLLHPAGSAMPAKVHLYLAFEDGTLLTATTQMWGAMELYEQGQERERQYVRDMRPTPIDPDFTLNYFSALIDDLALAEKRSAKGLLTQDQLIPGLGNAIAQDILFRARLHPKHPIDGLTADQRRSLYDAIITTVGQAIEGGGRCDEVDLYGRRGRYTRVMDKNAVGQPCPECGEKIEAIQYLGGACYLCPNCQT